MALDPKISILLDLYGALLTPKERDALDLYYNEDMSLQEIADNEAAERRERVLTESADGASATTGKTCTTGTSGSKTERATISRQGVRDAIKRAEAKLLEWEERLGLAKRAEQLEELAVRLEHSAQKLDEYSRRHCRIPDVDSVIAELAEVAAGLRE